MALSPNPDQLDLRYRLHCRVQCHVKISRYVSMARRPMHEMAAYTGPFFMAYAILHSVEVIR